MSDAREPTAPGGRAPGSRSERHRRARKKKRMPVKAYRSLGYLRHRYAPPAVVAAALVTVMGLAYLTRPEQAQAGSEGATVRAPVESTVVACPGTDGLSGSSRVALAGGAESSGAGRADIREIDGQEGGEPSAAVDQPGTAWYGDAGDDGPLAIRASGSLAAGLAAEQTVRVDGASPGLAGIRCTPPAMSSWFVGPGPSAQRGGSVYLTNVDATTATVDLDVFTPQGMMDPLGGRSVTVEPYSRERVGIDELGPNTRLTAIHVRTTTGRVSSAVRVRTEDAGGVDWLPNAREPGTDIVVPGVPKGNDARQLLVVAPGDRDATVKMEAVTKDGTYVPEGRESVQVPAGSVVGLNLAAGLSGKAAAVRLTSDVPVTAGAVATNESGVGASDVAFTAAAPALDGMSVVAENRAGAGRDSVLVLSAPGGAAQVQISMLTSEGAVGESKTVEVPAGRTVSVDLSAPGDSGEGFAAVIAPRSGSGPVHGGRVLGVEASGGELMTIAPLVTARTWVTVPDVGDSLSAVVTPR